MRRLLIVLVACLGFFAVIASARDIEDGKLIVKTTKDGKYQVGGTIGDKVAFYGIVGDVWQTQHDKGNDLTGLLLKKGENATPEQKHIIYVTAHNFKPPIPAYEEIDGKEQEIVEAAPAPSAVDAQPAAPAPAMTAQPAVPPPAITPPAQPTQQSDPTGH